MKNGRHRNIAPWAVWLLTVTALCAAEEKDAMTFLDGREVMTLNDWEPSKAEIRNLWCDTFFSH